MNNDCHQTLGSSWTSATLAQVQHPIYGPPIPLSQAPSSNPRPSQYHQCIPCLRVLRSGLAISLDPTTIISFTGPFVSYVDILHPGPTIPLGTWHHPGLPNVARGHPTPSDEYHAGWASPSVLSDYMGSVYATVCKKCAAWIDYPMYYYRASGPATTLQMFRFHHVAGLHPSNTPIQPSRHEADIKTRLAQRCRSRAMAYKATFFRPPCSKTPYSPTTFARCIDNARTSIAQGQEGSAFLVETY